MSYPVIITQRADAESENAFHYYEEQRSGLGFAFLDELKNVRQKLVEQPQFYSFVSRRENHTKCCTRPFSLSRYI